MRLNTSSDVLMVLAIVVAWYANISDRPGYDRRASLPPLPEAPLLELDPATPLPLLCCASRAGGTIQSIGSASSLPNRRVPCRTLSWGKGQGLFTHGVCQGGGQVLLKTVKDESTKVRQRLGVAVQDQGIVWVCPELKSTCGPRP